MSASDVYRPPTGGPEESDYSPDQLRRMRFWFLVLAVLSAGGWIGTFGMARLVNDLPLLLIVLAPMNRHLILVAPVVDPWEFLAVAMARGLLSCLVGFQLGRAVGEQGLRWLDGNSPGMGRFVRAIERLFQRSAPVAILLLPGFLVSLLSGVSGKSARMLFSLICIGLSLRLMVILTIGQWLMGPISWLLKVFDEYWLPITIGIIAAVALNEWRKRKRAERTQGAIHEKPAPSATAAPGAPHESSGPSEVRPL